MKKTPNFFLSAPLFKMGAFLTIFFLSQPLFAQSGGGILPSGMQSLADGILEIFTSYFVKVILAIMLCGSAVAYAFNKDNDKIKRNAIAVGIATAILITATSIIGAIWSASGG